MYINKRFLFSDNHWCILKILSLFFHLRWWTQFSSRFEIGKTHSFKFKALGRCINFCQRKIPFLPNFKVKCHFEKRIWLYENYSVINLIFAILKMKGIDVGFMRFDQTDFAISKIIKITIVVCKYKTLITNKKLAKHIEIIINRCINWN